MRLSFISLFASAFLCAASAEDPVPVTFRKIDEPLRQNEHKTNEWFRLGDDSYSITGAKVFNRISNDIYEVKASEGARFFVVYYKVRDDSDLPSEIPREGLLLQDSKGRFFSQDVKANIAMENDLIFTQLQPGVIKKTVAVFEVPEDSIHSPLEVIVPKNGEDEGYVTLFPLPSKVKTK